MNSKITLNSIVVCGTLMLLLGLCEIFIKPLSGESKVLSGVITLIVSIIFYNYHKTEVINETNNPFM